MKFPYWLRTCLSVFVFAATMLGESKYTAAEEVDGMNLEQNFNEDVEFLKRYVDTIVLQTESGRARVAVVPEYQGRVMTSSATGADGLSYGWINYEHIKSGESTPHINVCGGEERFWMGPEGGQFSIFFPRGAEFVFAKWQTPALIDTVPFAVTEQSDTSVAFQHHAKLTNYSGSPFEFLVERKVELLTATDGLGVDATNVDWVGYRTTNRLRNTGSKAWSKETGLLSIWILGMYKHGPQTTVVMPFNKYANGELETIVRDTYFGKVPADRLKIGDGVLYFAADGQYRSKIGLGPKRSTPICGSYDAARGVLTVVTYNKPVAGVTDYVNSMWELQKHPFAGDVINAYNDGPPEPGAEALGPFYELETSSPALALAPGESGEHVSETYHFEGDSQVLDHLSRRLLGVGLEQIESALQGDQ